MNGGIKVNEDKLYGLIKRAQTGDINAIELIVKKMSPKIRKSLYVVDPENREDLEQEIKLKLIEAIYKYEMKSVPGFWEFTVLALQKQKQAI